MKKVLQNLVKIIIIGSVLETRTVYGDEYPFPLAPLPYYHSFPDVVPTYSDPNTYSESNFPPLLYPEYNYQSPAQLFQPDENYHPLEPDHSNSHTPLLNVYSMEYPYPDYMFSQNLKRPPNYQITLHSNQNKQYSDGQISDYNVKNEEYPSQSNDEYNNNYQDDDYSDSFGDDSFQSHPCNPNSMYRYFEHNSNEPDSNNKFSLCGPYFHPHLGDNVYGLKTPLTLLPSRFPPRVEQFIEKIQNYFSTYTQPPVINPEHKTTTSTTVQPPLSTSSESETSVSLQSPDFHNMNGIVENHGETNTKPAPAVENISGQQVTEKAEVVPPFQNQQIFLTTEADVLEHQSPQIEVQTEVAPSIQDQELYSTTEANFLDHHSSQMEAHGEVVPPFQNHQMYSTGANDLENQSPQMKAQAEVVPPFQNHQIHSTTEADDLEHLSPQMEAHAEVVPPFQSHQIHSTTETDDSEHLSPQMEAHADVVPPFQNQQIYSMTEADDLEHQSPHAEAQTEKYSSQEVEGPTEFIVPETSPREIVQETSILPVESDILFPTKPSLSNIHESSSHESVTNELDNFTETTTERSVFTLSQTQVHEASSTESAQNENKTEKYKRIPTREAYHDHYARNLYR